MNGIDLRTRYLGLDLPHPVMASASPLTRSVDGICRLADAGAAAVVMSSIYEEQIVAAELAELALLEADGGTHPEASSGFFPEFVSERSVIDDYLQTLRRAAERAGVPVIASLNGVSRAGWSGFASQLEQAGAAAIELNVFRIPAELTESGEHIDRECVDVLRAVKGCVRIPVSVKLSPFHSSTGHFALQLVQAGADGLALFNRFYEPDIDLATLQPRPDFDLSTSADVRLGLTWMSLLHGHLGNTSLAATSGVWRGEDVVKYLLAGADVAMSTSALLRHGPQHIGTLVRELREWMERHGNADLDGLRGRLSATQRGGDPGAFLRAQYRAITTPRRI
ncbi:MAG TPA: dihydroorotate dehydrogenase-like protein [Burkholderiaceae bacterium]|jgi:dihydroorotate dehydrogenase (fumarate)|nr:dihydroorotate dehydrogenase-like protein [Burkholderiaceae bacterium]